MTLLSFALVVLTFWGIASGLITLVLMRRFTWRWTGILLRLLVLALLFLLPIADEVVAKPRFATLCKQETEIKVDKQKTFGKTVFLLPGERSVVPGIGVPVTRLRWRYADVESKDVLIEYGTLKANGGWLVRSLGISQTDSPILFNGHCVPHDQRSIFQELSVKQVLRRDAAAGGQ